jgi:hypothetical protein
MIYRCQQCGRDSLKSENCPTCNIPMFEVKGQEEPQATPAPETPETPEAPETAPGMPAAEPAVAPEPSPAPSEKPVPEAPQEGADAPPESA